MTEEEIVGAIKNYNKNISPESLNEVYLNFDENKGEIGVNGDFYLENIPASEVQNGFLLDFVKGLFHLQL